MLLPLNKQGDLQDHGVPFRFLLLVLAQRLTSNNGFWIQTEGDLELGSVGECLGHVILDLKGKKKNTSSCCTNHFSLNYLGIMVTAEL